MSILSKPWRVFSPALGQSLSSLTASNVTASQSQSHGAVCTDACRTYEKGKHARHRRSLESVNLSSYNSLSPLQGTQSFKSALIMKQH